MGQRGLTKTILGILSALVLWSGPATADPIEVGSGGNQAGLNIAWKDGFMVEYLVAFEQSSISGMDLLDIAEANSDLVVTTVEYSWGTMIDGFTYDSHSNSGYGGGEDWWHYWVKDSGQSEWTSPYYGASDRVLYDGDMDGWIYGSSADPANVPEPSSLLLAAAAAAILRRGGGKRRR